MTCFKSDRVAAKCSSCGEYQLSFTHVVEDGDTRTFWCDACCKVCNAPQGVELTGPVVTVAGEQVGLFDAAEGL